MHVGTESKAISEARGPGSCSCGQGGNILGFDSENGEDGLLLELDNAVMAPSGHDGSM